MLGDGAKGEGERSCHYQLLSFVAISEGLRMTAATEHVGQRSALQVIVIQVRRYARCYEAYCAFLTFSKHSQVYVMIDSSFPKATLESAEC